MAQTERPPRDAFNAKQAVRQAVSRRLRLEGFRGRFPTFRKRLPEDRYALLKFNPARTSSGGGKRPDRPAWRIETAVMRPGDEETLGAFLPTVMIRLMPANQIWSDIFELPDDIRTEANAEAFAAEAVATIVAEGPRFWRQVHWWEEGWTAKDPYKSYMQVLGTRPLLRLARLEEAWAAGTADLPRADVVNWLRMHGSDQEGAEAHKST